MGLRRLKGKPYINFKNESEDFYGHYTIVIFSQKERYNLNFAEYCLIDYIFNTSRRTRGMSGWSKAKVRTIARELGLTNRYIYKILDTLLSRTILQKVTGAYSLSEKIVWQKGNDGLDDESYTKFDNRVRQKLNLTFLEYATLKVLQNSIEISDTLLNQEIKITTVPKKWLAEQIDTNRETIQRILTRLEKRKFLERHVAVDPNGDKVYCINLKIDMEKEVQYEIDLEGKPIVPTAIFRISSFSN